MNWSVLGQTMGLLILSNVFMTLARCTSCSAADQGVIFST